MPHDFVRLATALRRAQALEKAYQLPPMTLEEYVHLLCLLITDVPPTKAVH